MFKLQETETLNTPEEAKPEDAGLGTEESTEGEKAEEEAKPEEAGEGAVE